MGKILANNNSIYSALKYVRNDEGSRKFKFLEILCGLVEACWHVPLLVKTKHTDLSKSALYRDENYTFMFPKLFSPDELF